MPSTPTTRRAAGLLAGGVALAALTGCTFTSHNVSCSSDGSCTAKLTGDGAEAEILGTTLTLGSVQDGRASISVAGASVSCAEGESVTAGSLELECTSVTEDSVELTASVG
jgi:hypothetical protein